jgi:hypothetical protein
MLATSSKPFNEGIEQQYARRHAIAPIALLRRENRNGLVGRVPPPVVTAYHAPTC